MGIPKKPGGSEDDYNDLVISSIMGIARVVAECRISSPLMLPIFHVFKVFFLFFSERNRRFHPLFSRPEGSCPYCRNDENCDIETTEKRTEQHRAKPHSEEHGRNGVAEVPYYFSHLQCPS